MIFRDAFYHADPHPGNLMLLPGGVVGVLDCGMTGRLDEELAESLDEMLMAVVNHDSVDLGDSILRLGSLPPATPLEELRAQLTDFVDDYVGHSIQDIDMNGALNSLLEIIRRYKIILPPPFSLLLRTLVELEGTARQLSPEFSLAEVVRPITPPWPNVVSRAGASLHGSSTLIAIGSAWPSLCLETWAIFSSGFATALSPSTWTFVISTQPSIVWCSG
jgi:predicted unusual protein kinase regulating ubiquinone biosynthesis (AarF/ABC1/UbiB family)